MLHIVKILMNVIQTILTTASKFATIRWAVISVLADMGSKL